MSSRDDPIGQTLGSYRIESLLGSGGMSAVYRAEHSSIGKRAAIKKDVRKLSKGVQDEVNTSIKRLIKQQEKELGDELKKRRRAER